MSNDGPSSLGALYESSTRQHSPVMPSVPGSIGTAYEAWFAADQEAQWLRALEERRERANSDTTTLIPTRDLDDYARDHDTRSPWDAGVDLRHPHGDPSETTQVLDHGRGAGARPAEQARPAEAPASTGQAASGGILRSSALMAAGTLVSRVLGVLRSILTVAALTATGHMANVWEQANSLPNIIYLLLAGGVINAVLVPQITRALEHSDGGKAYTDRIVTLTLTILAGVTVIFMAAAPLVYRLYDNNNITDEKLRVAWILSLICLPQIFFYGVYTIFGQVLNARGHFGAFMWSPALANIVIIIGLIGFMMFYPHGDNVPDYAGWSTTMMFALALPATLGIALQAAVLIPVLRKAGYSFTPNFQFRGVGLRSASTMASWAFAAVVLQQIGLVVTSQLLMSQPDGEPGKAAQGQAFLLFTLPHSIITLSLVTALFTRMSVAAGRGETDKVKEDLATGIRLSGIASVMLTFGCFALVFPLVGAMFTPAPDTVWAIGSIAISMMIGLVPYALCLVIQRVFYAYGDAKTPFWMQVICTSTAVGLTLPWFALKDTHMLGHPGTHWVGVGVGLAQTLSNVVQAGVGFVWLKKRLGHIPMAETVRMYVRLSIAAVAATAVGYVFAKLIGSMMDPSRLSSIVTISIAGTVFLGVYFVVAQRLRVQEINQLLGPVTRRLKRA